MEARPKRANSLCSLRGKCTLGAQNPLAVVKNDSCLLSSAIQNFIGALAAEDEIEALLISVISGRANTPKGVKPKDKPNGPQWRSVILMAQLLSTRGSGLCVNVALRYLL